MKDLRLLIDKERLECDRKLLQEDVLICDDCGIEGATKGTCPYASEIHDQEVEVCLCQECYYQRSMDI